MSDLFYSRLYDGSKKRLPSSSADFTKTLDLFPSQPPSPDPDGHGVLIKSSRIIDRSLHPT